VLTFSTNQFLELASNFHLLLYLLTNDVLKFEAKEIRELCQIVKNRDRSAAVEWSENNGNWGTFLILINANRS
jgi:nuclear protein localization family protein 4